MKKLFIDIPTYNRPEAIRIQLRVSYATVSHAVKQSEIGV